MAKAIAPRALTVSPSMAGSAPIIWTVAVSPEMLTVIDALPA